MIEELDALSKQHGVTIAEIQPLLAKAKLKAKKDAEVGTPLYGAKLRQHLNTMVEELARQKQKNNIVAPEKPSKKK